MIQAKPLMVDGPFLTLSLRQEQDVVLVRQRARHLAAILGLDTQNQTSVATAVSEIARNAYQYATGGRVEFALDQGGRPALVVRVQDDGPGIEDLDAVRNGTLRSGKGLGLGLAGARRLMDAFDIETAAGSGTRVTLVKAIPGRVAPFLPADVAAIVEELARRVPDDPLRVIQQQNGELLRALEELSARQEELARLNRELEDTNRGVVALYAELDEKADHLKRLSDVKSRFLSDMSHELRTPLNSIISLARILQDHVDGDLTDEQERQVGYIRQAAETLSDIVNDLLDLAKVEAGKVTVKPAEFRVPDLFGALRGMLRPLLTSGSPVSLVFEEPDKALTLVTDEGKVAQILRNFVSNALKFTEKGEVRVSATEGPADSVIFSVADTGIGIDPKDQSRIFDEYSQVENEHQQHARGTGLGLPLSHRLALMLGGNILLESEPGRGSTFHALIPRHYTGPAEITVAPSLLTRVDADRLPVLVVEDNRETIFIYEKYLQGSAFQVVAAHTTAEARYLIREVHPVAIVLDILLDGESAWDFLTELKNDPGLRDLPVLVLTVVDNARRALAMGADAFHMKPVESGWLVDRLTALTASPAKPVIMIADDEEASRHLVRSALEGDACRFIEAFDGEEALSRARAERPDAIILDLMMPKIDGWEVLRTLREDPMTQDIPVIIHSSSVLSASEQEAIAREGVAVVEKDGSSPQLLGERLREALSLVGVAGALQRKTKNA